MVGSTLATALAGLSVVTAVASPARADGATLYAYARGAGTTTGCPASSTRAQECSLQGAFDQAAPGDTVLLADGGSAVHYVGNWRVATGADAGDPPVTLGSAPGLASRPVLDGNLGRATSCTTSTCSGPVITVDDDHTSLSVSGVELVNAGDGQTGGGAIYDGGLGQVTVDDVHFTRDVGDHGTVFVAGRLSVTRSLFDHGGGDAAAIYADGAKITVDQTTFSDNTSNDFGGAVELLDGSLTVTRSTFVRNAADSYGGAIGLGGGSGGAVARVVDSTFTDNHVDSGGGAIAVFSEGDATATLALQGSTLVGDEADSMSDEVIAISGSRATLAGNLIAGACRFDPGHAQRRGLQRDREQHLCALGEGRRGVVGRRARARRHEWHRQPDGCEPGDRPGPPGRHGRQAQAVPTRRPGRHHHDDDCVQRRIHRHPGTRGTHPRPLR